MTVVPVRILEITSYPPPRAGWGVRVEHVRNHLRSQGHECVVLNTGKSRQIKSPEYEDLQNGLDYVRKVWRYSLKGYTVHAHVNGDSPKGFVLTLLAELINLCCGRRCYLTFHAGPVQRYFPQHRSRLLVPVFRLIFAIPRIIICNSQPVKDRIAGYGVASEKIVPIPAFSRQYLDFERAALPPRLEAFMSSADPLVCSYVFFRPEFFIESLIRGFKLVADRRPGAGLAIMGSDADSESIKALVRELGLADRVMFCGDLPHDQFLTIMTRSRMYVRTPSKDGVCSSVLEALALGVPVVASENGTRPPSVITFKPDDLADLAERIEYVLDHEEDVRRRLVRPEIRDTVAEESALLAGTAKAGTA